MAPSRSARCAGLAGKQPIQQLAAPLVQALREEGITIVGDDYKEIDFRTDADEAADSDGKPSSGSGGHTVAPTSPDDGDDNSDDLSEVSLGTTLAPTPTGTVPQLSARRALPHVTLSRDCRLTWLCRQVPMVLMYGSLILLGVTALWSPPIFGVIFLLLNVHIFLWMARTGIFGTFGAGYVVPRWCGRDWAAAAEAVQEVQEVQHFVIIPNYKEGFEVLDATVRACAESCLAQRCVRVVLAMEDRDPDARDVAARLCAKYADRFLDIFATFHPANLPMEVAGKSSNTNWAFQEVSRRARALELDPMLTVVHLNDADCLWHPDYFTAVALDVSERRPEEKQWLIWQAPQLGMRNHFDVPMLTRVTGYSSALLELAGLTCPWGAHICYSSYSMLLALADRVQGWDVDVIAEDHHMFCKCFFASIQSGDEVAQSPSVRLEPVFLPLKSYMVEAASGSSTVSSYLESLKARFVQARRHMQGITEFSYVLLQWIETVRHFGPANVPAGVHIGTLRILWSMLCVHLLPFLHLGCVILAYTVYARRAFGGEVVKHANALFTMSPVETCAPVSDDVWEQFNCWVFVLCPHVFLLPTCFLIAGSTVVLSDFTRANASGYKTEEPLIEEGVCQQQVWNEELGGTPMYPWMRWRAIIALQIGLEITFLSWLVIVLFGFVPEALAVAHLAYVGTQFKYVVAEKPVSNSLPEQRALIAVGP